MIMRRKMSFNIILVIGVAAVLFTGCVTIKDEIYLQNADIEGTLNQLPVHITERDMVKKSFHLSPHVSVKTNKTYSSTHLGRSYTGQIPDSLTDFKRKDILWDLPSFRFGIDMDYAITNDVAFMAGISSSTGKEYQFTAAYAGVGLYSPDTTLGFRLDVGMQYSENSYRGSSIIVRTTTQFNGSSSKETGYFLDRGKEFHLNLFASLTLNSSHKNWPVNYFLQIGISPQTLTSFTPVYAITTEPYGVTHIVSDERAESSVTWLSVTPGVYVPIGENKRLVVGARLMTDVRSLPESAAPGVLVTPMIQLDWGL